MPSSLPLRSPNVIVVVAEGRRGITGGNRPAARLVLFVFPFCFFSTFFRALPVVVEVVVIIFFFFVVVAAVVVVVFFFLFFFFFFLSC